MGTIQFTKENSGVGDGSVLEGTTRIKFGASWDTSTRGKKGVLGWLNRKGGLDIDLIAVLMQGKKAVKYVGLDNLDPVNGAIVHSGDNTTGHGDGDDEVLDVRLNEIPLDYSAIIFTASVFKGDAMNAAARGMDTSYSTALSNGFKGAKNVEFTVYDESPASTWVGSPKIMPDLMGNDNCILIARLVRTSMTDMNAPWAIEIMEKLVKITPNDMDSLLRHCKDATP